MNGEDVPSPIDFQDPADALEWERTAQARPGRSEMFRAFADELKSMGDTDFEVLELGSGPGFLASYLLSELPHIRMTLLDFSAAMHELARVRLGQATSRVRFIQRSFKDSGWEQDLGLFDAVVTNQAVHELRHKKHALHLHASVKGLLKPEGAYLVCDHFYGDGGLENDQLYMTILEQQDTLVNAGFSSIRQVITAGSLAMHHAT